MASQTILVLTTVHHPDDARIREKLIRTLGEEAEVLFAARPPGPSDASGLRLLALRGGRMRRNLEAWRLALTNRYDVLSLHDPETLPLGLAIAVLRRKRVVFDVHEDIPEQVMMRGWVPRPLRPVLAALSGLLLRLAERTHEITLAEAGYQRLFRKNHPVFPNYLPASMRAVQIERGGFAVYLGDVTEERGLLTATTASAQAGIPLTIIGRFDDEFRAAIEYKASQLGGVVHFKGRLSHPEALALVGQAVVGLSPLRDLPNYRHSLPTKILEYLAMGVPVVATDLPGTRAVIDGLDAVEAVPPDDEQAMADAIGRAVGKVDAAIAQSEAIRKRFRWPADEVAAFYN